MEGTVFDAGGRWDRRNKDNGNAHRFFLGLSGLPSRKPRSHCAPESGSEQQIMACGSNLAHHMFYKYRFSGTHPYFLVYILSVAAFALKWINRVVVTETICPAKPKIFIYSLVLTKKKKKKVANLWSTDSVDVSAWILGSA